jgi:hypothetical protein
MDYLNQITQLKDKLHREIVQQATSKTAMVQDDCDGMLTLKEPITVVKEYYRPYCGDEGYPTEEVDIVGINCNTGELVSYQGNEDRWIRYNQLTLEEMAVLHLRVVQQKDYSFTKNRQLV